MKQTNFYQRLRIVVKQSGLTDTEFAQRLGVGKSTLSGYLAGTSQPKQDTITLIVRDFSVNANWLLLGEGEPEAGAESRMQCTALSDDLPIARAVAQVEQAMRSVGVDEEAIWRSLKTMVDNKLDTLGAGLAKSVETVEDPYQGPEQRRVQEGSWTASPKSETRLER